MTAASIAKELEIETVETNYLFGEWLDRSFYYHGNPISELEINNRPLKKIEKKLGVKMVHN